MTMFSSLENRDNFYVNLPSNVPGLAQTNHPSHFKVALPERIRLRGTWEVGLAEIFIPSYGFNIKPLLTSSVVIYTKGTMSSGGYHRAGRRRHLRVRIPEGRYKPKDYVRTFNKMVEDDAGPVKVKSRMRYDEYSNRIIFMVGFGEVVEVDNVKLRRMFGMRRDIFALTNSKPGKKLYIMPKPCDFNVNGTTMFVYSNIAASSPVGNTFAPLLRTVHLEIDDKMETLHKNYTSIHYFPVRTSEFDTIEVQLCNVYGDDMVFYGGESAIVLHFRKVAE